MSMDPLHCSLQCGVSLPGRNLVIVAFVTFRQSQARLDDEFQRLDQSLSGDVIRMEPLGAVILDLGSRL